MFPVQTRWPLMQRTFTRLQRGGSASRSRRIARDEDHRTVTDLLVDQVEFADVIVLNKMDLIDDEQARKVEGAVKALNPGAKIMKATHGEVPLESVLDTGLFDYERAESSAGWIKELQGEHTPETEAYGISSLHIGLRT